MTLPYSFGTGTTSDQNFFKQLQANFAAEIVDRDAAIAAAVAAAAPQLAKAWASVSVLLTVPTLEAGYNVASVTFVSTGRYTITLTTPFSSVNWVPEVICCTFGGGDFYSGIRAISASAVDVIFNDAAGTRSDPITFYFVGFGTQ